MASKASKKAKRISGKKWLLVATLVVGALLLPRSVSPIERLVTKATTPAVHAVDRMPDNAAWTYDFSSLPDGALPSGDWNVESGYGSNHNGEQSTYTSRSDNVRVENGVLVIEAKPESSGGHNYTSGRINTQGKFDFEYGTLEVEAMLTEGTGSWPAAWLIPEDPIYNRTDYGIPRTDPLEWVLNGEIDFLEAVGHVPGQNLPAAHSYNSRKSGVSQYTPAYVENPYGAYHRYGIIKAPDKITFTLDGVPYATRQKTGNSALDWPFNQPYYLILNLSIGGDWAGSHGIDNAHAPWLYKIKSISYQPL
jgi:beta-glucanase (GH16 family)